MTVEMKGLDDEQCGFTHFFPCGLPFFPCFLSPQLCCFFCFSIIRFHSLLFWWWLSSSIHLCALHLSLPPPPPPLHYSLITFLHIIMFPSLRCSSSPAAFCPSLILPPLLHPFFPQVWLGGLLPSSLLPLLIPPSPPSITSSFREVDQQLV